jgi:hypothetical protein
MSATLLLTLSFLTVDTTIDKKGHTTQVERIAYTTTAIHYDSRQACANAQQEWQFAVGAYQMSKRPTRIITAICNDNATGVVE